VAVRRCVDRRRILFAAQIRNCLCKVSHGYGLDPGELGLGRALRRAQQFLEAATTSALGSSEHASDRTQPAVEPELSDRGVPGQALRRHLPGGREYRECDREVEAGPLLAKLRGSEVDGDPPYGPVERCRGDPAADPFLRLLAGAVGKAHDRKRGHGVLKVSLDVDAASIQADESVSDRPCEHAATLETNVSRVCDATVP